MPPSAQPSAPARGEGQGEGEDIHWLHPIQQYDTACINHGALPLGQLRYYRRDFV